MGNIKVRGKMQRIAVIDANRVVGRAVRYSTIKDEEGNSVFAAIAGPLFLASQRHNVTRHKKSQKSQTIKQKRFLFLERVTDGEVEGLVALEAAGVEIA